MGMVRIEVDYRGQLHTVCRHAPSGRELETDAPKDNRGLGESFSPTDLLATALGSCMLTVMGIAARRHGWALEGVRARVDKHMESEPVRRICRLQVELSMPAGLPAESREILEQSARGCPVMQSISPSIEVDARFDWGD